MKLHATVLHNVSDDMFFGYKPKTSKLFHAHTFEVEADNITKAADLIWTLANADGEDLRLVPHLSSYCGQVAAYRARQNRSLSVGDVIVFTEGERVAGTVAVAMIGFDALPKPPQVDLSDLANVLPISIARQAHLDLLVRAKEG